MTFRELVVDTIGTLVCIAAALMLGGCGGADPGPCVNPGAYCAEQTLCIDNEPTQCDAVPGGACNNGLRQVGGSIVIQPKCIVRPPAPERK